MPKLMRCGYCNDGVDATPSDDILDLGRLCDQCNGKGKVVVEHSQVRGRLISKSEARQYRRKGYEVIW